MNAIILAGGRGTRLGKQPYPKSLMKFYSKKILDQNIKCLPKYSNLFFILCDQHEKILRYLNKKKISYEYKIEETPLGTGGWINLIDIKQLSENFIVCNGDNLIELDWLDAIIQHISTNAYVTIVGTKVKDSFDSGTIELHNNKIISFTEKTGQHVPALINTGFYIFNKNVLNYIRKNLKHKNKIMLEKDIFPELIKTKRLFVYEHKGKWAGCDTKTKIKEAEEMFLKNDE